MTPWLFDHRSQESDRYWDDALDDAAAVVYPWGEWIAWTPSDEGVLGTVGLDNTVNNIRTK